MRETIKLNTGWAFLKDAAAVPAQISGEWEAVDLPHTWNAVDGQDGGNDYYRGTCFYARKFAKADLPAAERVYLEVNGANASGDVHVNGRKLAHHDGGYSTWRVDITDALQQENLLVIAVDNSANETVYPQVADFTFYGGLYRDVNLICVPASHFDLDCCGGPGIKVTPIVDGSNANVEVEVFTTGMRDGQCFRYTVCDADGKIVAREISHAPKAVFTIENAHKWHGRKDPYLYTAQAELAEGEEILDQVSARFGCRTFEIHPENGFILNGEEYPLRGVSRHQDRWGIGNALLPEHHEEDMDLICEIGCTTVRLAHYQHDQYFYDLCDERGIIVWAEIPYISNHMSGARENTISQMKELVIQNYNHPSIVVWGLSNEITIGGSSEDLMENLRILNDLCHELDTTRLTTMAYVSPCNMTDAIVRIPDVVSYNHYFGWYGGETDMYGPWFDKFHQTHPNIPIGCSEYGCEGLNWHTSNPVQGDYTEEYQALYHEEVIRQLFSRKYIWATHVWNMFDFGADARSEGGENGQNHKGLVTFDRSYKKDAFYAYKAWLSDEPFVHLCGKRYVDRVEDVTRVTVYSNQPAVELFANGVSLGVREASDHFFHFEVPNKGQTHLTAVSGSLKDESHIRKVEVFNEAYRLKGKTAVLNWFDITQPEGRFSLNDKVSEIMATFRGKLLFMAFAAKMLAKKKGKVMGSFEMNDTMMTMVGGFTVIRLATMAAGMGFDLTREQLLAINARLNKIRKPRK